MNTDNPGVRKAARFGVYRYNNSSNDLFLFKESQINKAMVQIVRGLKYMLHVEIGRTMCEKREHSSLDSCHFQRKKNLQRMLRCYFEVWITPWLRKAYVPVALCHWLTFPHESLTYRGSTTMSFSLPGLLRPKLKWERLYRIATEPFSQAHGCFSLLERCSKSEWQRQDLPWLNLLLSSCVSVFPKLNCRWEHVVIHSVENHAPSGWISKQCERTQEALLDLLYSLMNLHTAMM